MAIIKAKTLEDGFTSEYWRVDEIFYNKDAKSFSGILILYKDRPSRESGKSSVKRYGISFSNVERTDFEIHPDPIKFMYEKVKTEGEWVEFFLGAESDDMIQPGEGQL